MAFLSAFSAIQTDLHCIRRPEVAGSHVLMAEKVRAALSSLSSLSMSVAPGSRYENYETRGCPCTGTKPSWWATTCGCVVFIYMAYCLTAGLKMKGPEGLERVKDVPSWHADGSFDLHLKTWRQQRRISQFNSVCASPLWIVVWRACGVSTFFEHWRSFEVCHESSYCKEQECCGNKSLSPFPTQILRNEFKTRSVAMCKCLPLQLILKSRRRFYISTQIVDPKLFSQEVLNMRLGLNDVWGCLIQSWSNIRQDKSGQAQNAHMI